MIRKDPVGPSPYPTYILPTTKLTPPPTANPFRPVAVSCVLIHTRITVGGMGLKRSSVGDTLNANGSAAKSTGFPQDWALPQLDRLKNDPRSQGTSDAPRNTSPYYAHCGRRSHTCTLGSCTCIYSPIAIRASFGRFGPYRYYPRSWAHLMTCRKINLALEARGLTLVLHIRSFALPRRLRTNSRHVQQFLRRCSLDSCHSASSAVRLLNPPSLLALPESSRSVSGQKNLPGFRRPPLSFD